MLGLVILEKTTTTDAFSQMAEPIVDLLNSALPPIIAIVGAIGVIYCVFLGLKLAKAEEPQEREKAKGHLKNAIIGFVLIFVLMVALNVGIKPLSDWVTNNTGLKTTQQTTQKS